MSGSAISDDTKKTDATNNKIYSFQKYKRFNLATGDFNPP